MTPEQLLAPRYKVIALYPGYTVAIGKVFESEIGSYYDQYPAVFQKLEWWEERSESDMPQYVKWSNSYYGEVSKVGRWTVHEDGSATGFVIINGNLTHASGAKLMPATETEYIAYTQTVKP